SLERLERQPCIQQRAEDHVARGTVEAVEVEDPHGLPGRRRKPETVIVAYRRGPIVPRPGDGCATTVTRAANAADTALVKGAMTFARDIRYGARALAKAPVFTLLAVAVLAAGIGATTAIFSLVDAVLLRPLPYRAPDRLMFLAEAA